MIQVLQGLGDGVLGVRLSGRLHDEDHDRFVPMVDRATTEQGKVRLLVEFADFHGWSDHALWNDLNFAAEHSRDIERLAMVGATEWEDWMAKVAEPFTKAEIRRFGPEQTDMAREWISG
jgi:hypothetical protein